MKICYHCCLLELLFVCLLAEQTNDQKCVKSWSVKPGFNFSQPAIQHPRTETFYVIQRSKTIYSWSLTTELEKGLSIEVDAIPVEISL